MDDVKLLRIGMEALKSIKDPDWDIEVDEMTRKIFIKEQGYWSQQYTAEIERVPWTEWFESAYRFNRQEAERRVLCRFLMLAAYEERLEITVKGVVANAT